MIWPAGVGRLALPTTDSTNAEGLRLMATATTPVWITAAQQTAGRGRRARPWASPPGNLYATLAMRVHEAPQTVALRSFIAALALREAIVTTTGTATGLSLKWPNDVLMNGGKVAGILLEAQSLPGAQALAIGIGVNLISHPESTGPDAIPPVSILSQTGVRLTPDTFLPHLAAAYAGWEATFLSGGFAPIRTEWLAHAARLGEPIRARTGSQTREGVFQTVDAQGNLMLRMVTGTVAIPAAEVFF